MNKARQHKLLIMQRNPKGCLLQVAARAGGIFFPLAQSLALACDSDPKNGTEDRMGAYLMKTCFQTSTISSAMFITAMVSGSIYTAVIFHIKCLA